jgi:hypothetical protein
MATVVLDQQLAVALNGPARDAGLEAAMGEFTSATR